MLFFSLYFGVVQADVPKKMPPSKERGETLYAELCWQCHGAQGKGDGPLARIVQASGIAGVGKEKEKEYIDIIQNGKGRMPAYAEVIDRHDSRRILLWLRDPKPSKSNKEEKQPKEDVK
jgi:mono/diheme cytochrome c family protein